MQSAVCFSKIVLSLFRRQYGDIGRFSVMIMKLLKATKFDFYMTQLLSQDIESDKLEQRRAIQKIVVTSIKLNSAGDLSNYFDQLMHYCLSSNISFGAVIELLEENEQKTTYLISLPKSCKILFGAKPKSSIMFNYVDLWVSEGR